MAVINNILIKPVGPRCNLACRYCFYRRVEQDYPGPRICMPNHILEKMISDFLKLRLETTSFCWQGGEPTLAGLHFFERAVELMKKYGEKGQRVGNAFQTNGLRIDDQWVRFLSKYQFLLGVSLDGPPEIHDAWRVRHDQKGSFDKAFHAAKDLIAGGVEVQILVTTCRGSEGQGQKVFEWMTKHGFYFTQIIPVVEFKPDGTPEPFSISAQGYGQYLCDYFDAWWAMPPHQRSSERTIDSLLAFYVNDTNPTCTFQKQCGSYLLIENNGDVYPCDFYVRPDMRLGNLLDRPFYEYMDSPTMQKFIERKSKVHASCKECEFLHQCWGDCQRSRANSGKSILCAGLKQFYAHTKDRLQSLAEEIKRAGTAPRSTQDSLGIF